MSDIEMDGLEKKHMMYPEMTKMTYIYIVSVT